VRDSLLEILVDPTTKERLQLVDASNAADGDIDAGVLVGGARRFAIAGGIPRFVEYTDAGQDQTSASFGYKWQQTDSYDSGAVADLTRRWMVARYGFEDLSAMTARFARARRILDAGCGSGYSSSIWMTPEWFAAGSAEWYGADISEAIDVARQRLGTSDRLHYVQADIGRLPFADASFDVIFSEGVMHHTPSTERAFRALVPLLAPGGEFMFYVYRRKSPMREFADDYIRDIVSPLEPAAALEALRPLTALARALAELHATVDVTADVPLLGIRAGRHDVQRLVYWHFAKLFWNDGLSFDENNLVNFDWYHPRYAHRHTEEEVRGWCADAGLEVTHFDTTNESGFTVRAVRR
jgi:SAM-dependent methyltransferase